MITYVIISTLIACTAGALWLVVRSRWLSRNRAATDNALGQLYARYNSEVEIATRMHMLEAPADEAWLAEIKARASAPEAKACPSSMKTSCWGRLLRFRPPSLRWVTRAGLTLGAAAIAAGCGYLMSASVAGLVAAGVLLIVIFIVGALFGVIFIVAVRVKDGATMARKNRPLVLREEPTGFAARGVRRLTGVGQRIEPDPNERHSEKK